VTFARLLRVYRVEAAYECLRMLRAPGFGLPFLALPLLLYLLFAVLIYGGAGHADPSIARFLFAAFAVLGVSGPGLFGFGLVLATEREQGLLRLKRALPMPPAASLVARTLMAMLFGALIMATVLPAALALGGLPATPAQVLATTATGILGAVPFCALGLFIGARTSGRAAPAVVNLVYQPMLHLSGLFYPLPKALAAAAPIWPTYHLQRLVLAAAGAEGTGDALVHVAVLGGATLVFGGLAIRRLARG
jgi:ABC-2 type transport system permease protein